MHNTIETLALTLRHAQHNTTASPLPVEPSVDIHREKEFEATGEK
jgi:hypothetical protein